MSRIAISLALVVFALGCSRSEEAQAPAAAATETTEPVAAAPPAESAAPAMPYEGFDYTCPDGVTFNAKLDKGNALVTIDGKTSTLPPAPGANGAQFSGEGLTFTARGEEATLHRDGAPVQNCKAKPS